MNRLHLLSITLHLLQALAEVVFGYLTHLTDGPLDRQSSSGSVIILEYDW